MLFHYPLSSIDKTRIEDLKTFSDIKKSFIEKDMLILESDSVQREAEELLSSSSHYSTYTFKAEIDCAECAHEVEEALEKNMFVAYVSFNFPKKTLKVISSLKEEEIKAICREAEDEIVFLKDEEKKYVFSVSIDCAECAREVEEELASLPQVKNAIFDYPKGKLIVTTTLSEKEIMEEAKKIEDEIVFHTSRVEEGRDYSIPRLSLSILLLIASYILGLPLLSIASFLVAGYDVILKAIKNITKGKVFDENFLMAAATIAAICVKSYEEAAAVMVFYQIGEYFQNLATNRSRESIGKLLDLSVDKVTVLKGEEWIETEPEKVEKGSLFMVKGGEKVALDGVIEEGEGYIDTRALTGESVPVKVRKGERILSGSVNMEATLILRSIEEYSESTASKIMKLVEDGEGKKAKSEKFITLFSRYYTPIVTLSALILAILPPLFGTPWKESIYRAAMLLVISCPCALVLSVPLTYFASMGAFAKTGLLVKGDEAIHNMARVKTFVFDKTGTLTEGVFTVQKTEFLTVSEEKLATLAKALERESTHPIATAIMALDEGEEKKAEKVRTIPGVGMEGIVDGHTVRVGSARIGENLPLLEDDGTHVYVAEDGVLLGVYVISDRIRDNASSTITRLKEMGVERTTILSGDRKDRVEKTARILGIDSAYGELLPDGKLETMETLKKDGILAYCGDGINDAPTLAAADVSIAFGGVGSDSAIEASDFVIMDDRIEKLPLALTLAKRTERIVKENIGISLSVKAIVFVLALMGIANMWLAVIADTGVSLVAVANALRALKHRITK